MFDYKQRPPTKEWLKNYDKIKWKKKKRKWLDVYSENKGKITFPQSQE